MRSLPAILILLGGLALVWRPTTGPAPTPAPAVVTHADLREALAANPAKRRVLSGFYRDFAAAVEARPPGTGTALREWHRRALELLVKVDPVAASDPAVGEQIDAILLAELGDSPGAVDAAEASRALLGISQSLR